MRRTVAVLAVFAAVTTACGGDGSTTAGGADVEVDGVEPAASSDHSATSTTEAPPPLAAVPDEELAAMAAANNDFALDLFRVLLPGAEPNLTIGPWNISEGLALPWTGARGETAAEMEAALRFDLPTETQHAAFATLRDELRSRVGDELSLTMANRLFGQSGLEFHDEFLADQSRFYEAPMQTVDFTVDNGEVARHSINEWTAANTGDRITELFPPGTISGRTLLALVAAVHFEADWKYPFDPELTRLEPFFRADGTQINVEMMRYDWYLPNAEIGDASAVKIPYVGDEMSFVAVLPSGDLDGYVDRLDAEGVRTIQDSLLGEQGIHLRIPKFEMTSHVNLVGPLQQLGVTTAFGPGADFSGMSDAGLFVGTVEHEAFIRIDEVGTEAAAATGTDMPGSHGPSIDLDRPFIFWVQDDVTGQILFLGRVGDPDPTKT